MRGKFYQFAGAVFDLPLELHFLIAQLGGQRSAAAIGGPIFLILEMDRPLEGVMQISSWPVENALAHMKW